MTTISETKNKGIYLFTTWVNHPNNTIALYNVNGQIVEISYRNQCAEVCQPKWAMSLAWFHINRTTGWPCTGIGIDRKVSISQEAQDLQCKMMLRMN